MEKTELNPKKSSFKKKIGWAQVITAVLLIIISLSIAKYSIFKIVDTDTSYLPDFKDNANQIAEMLEDNGYEWDDENLDMEEATFKLIYYTGYVQGIEHRSLLLALLCSLEVIIMILSLMMIFQGLVNIKE